MAVIAGLAIRSVRGRKNEAIRSSAWSVCLVAAAAACAYLPILWMPLITDDYIHISQISNGQAPTAIGCLTHSCGGPQVFRPIGFAIYWAEWGLWGTAAMPRHALDLVLQVAISVLFVLLLRRLGTPPPFDWLGGLVFALNGIGPERVAWPAARFDTLAILFSLMAALAILRGRLAVCALATVAACMSKESAFVLPVLLALLVCGALIKVWPSFLAAAAVFAWRWVVLKGIGGYVDQTGAPTVFQFDALKLVKTLLWRIWGVLWFPINWSRPLEWWMWAAVAAGVLGSLALFRSRPDRTRVWLCIAGVMVSCLPVHHMLLIGPSLERSRYLAYASPVLVLLLVTAASGRRGMVALGLLAAFHLGALEHNLNIWRSVAQARYDLCHSGRAVSVQDMPLTVDGVYWRNGFEECVAQQRPLP